MADSDNHSSGLDFYDTSIRSSHVRRGKPGPKPSQNAPVLNAEGKSPNPDVREITARLRFRDVHQKSLYKAVHPELDCYYEDTLVNIRSRERSASCARFGASHMRSRRKDWQMG